MDRLLIVGLVIVLAGIGLFRILRLIQAIEAQNDFVVEFHNKFTQYINNPGKDTQAHQWLVAQMDKMQSEVGQFGIMAYRPPYSDYIVQNFQIFINLIPAIRDGFALGEDLARNAHIRMISDSLTRYQGQLLRDRDSVSKYLHNPILWFRDGVQAILNFPIFILYQFGVLGRNLYKSWIDSRIFKFIGSLVSIIAFFSALVSIVAGWDAFVIFIQRIFNRQ